MSPRVLVSAAVFGFVAGLRSQVPRAALARRGLLPSTGRLAFGSEGAAARGLDIAAVGELLADKLPSTPSRVSRGPLIGRIGSGALAGASLAAGAGRRGSGLVLPSLLGAAGAFLGSWAGYLARKRVVDATGLPDPVVAVAEDAVAIALAARA